MKHRLHPLFTRFMRPADDDFGSDTGGTGTGSGDDRGDDYVPTDDGEDRGDDHVATDDDAPTGEEEKPAPKAKAKAPKTDDKDDDEDGEEGDDKKDDKRKDTRIPVSRHKALLEKERTARTELEQRLAKYEQGDRIAATNDAIKDAETKLDKLDEEYTKLVTDGEHEKAALKRREMRALESEIVEKKSDLKAQAATSRAIEKVRYDTAVERLESAYPMINADHDDFDPETAQDVLDLATTYRARGMTPADAIQKAAKKLLGAETKKQDEATSVKPRVNKEDVEREERDQGKGKEKEAERRQAQVKKNLEAGKKQPPDTSRVGADSDRAGGGLGAKDVMRMTQDDFNKLDEATLARLRGDTLA